MLAAYRSYSERDLQTQFDLDLLIQGGNAKRINSMMNMITEASRDRGRATFSSKRQREAFVWPAREGGEGRGAYRQQKRRKDAGGGGLQIWNPNLS